MKTTIQQASLLALLIGASTTAFAQAPEGAPQGPPEGFSLGLAVLGSNGIYVGEDASAQILPILRYESEAFSASLPEGLRLSLWDQTNFRMSAILAPRINPIGGSDAKELDGLDRAQFTFDGGLSAEYSFGFGTQVLFRGVTELGDEHGGSELSIGIEQVVPLGDVPLFLGADVTWQDEDLADFLYGVSASEATADRAAYSPGAVVIPSITLGTVVPLSQSISMVANLRAEFLPDEVTDSSIIDEDLGLTAVLGLSYRF